MRAAVCGILAAAISYPVLAQDKAESKRAAKQSASKDSGDGTLSKQDARFLRQMGSSDLVEVETGKLAAGKASSPEVKKFAQHMVDEHGKGVNEGKALAKSKGVELPSQPDKRHQAAMKKLEGQNGATFDKAYINQMIKDHQDTLKLVQAASKKAGDSEIKAAAEKKAPVVEKHLEMARGIAASLKGDTGDSPKTPSGKSAKSAPAK
jgi:putative membrane protein